MSNLELKGVKPLGEYVFEHLKEAILNGDLPPGTRIMEVELSEQLGVSRTPVREAIRRLAKENFVEMYPRRGTYVAKLTKNDILQVLEIRKELEGFAASLSALRMTIDEIEALRIEMECFNRAMRNNDKTEMIKYDNSFHFAILNGTRNNKLIDIIFDLHDQFQRFRLLYFSEIENFAEVQTSHQKIFDAINQNDPVRARREAEFHVETIRELVIEWIDR